MKKIINLIVVLTAVCTITTVLNGAVPPGELSPGRKLKPGVILREIAIASRLGQMKDLGPAPTQLIQEYLVPRTVSIQIVNADNTFQDVNIQFQNTSTGDEIASFILFFNREQPHIQTQVISLMRNLYDQSEYREESWEQLLARATQEGILASPVAYPFERLVNLPLIPITIRAKWRASTEEQQWYDVTDRGAFATLTPSELENIQTIRFNNPKSFEMHYHDGRKVIKEYSFRE